MRILYSAIVTIMMTVVFMNVGNAYAEIHYVQVRDASKSCSYTNSCFLPNITNVTVGDTVVWVGDTRDHHIINTTNGEKIDINLSQNVVTFSHVFNSTGSFPYIDPLYPWSSGQIIVRPYTLPPVIYDLNFIHPVPLTQPIAETKTLIQSIPDWLKFNLITFENGKNDDYFLQAVQYFNETKSLHIKSSSLTSNDKSHVPSWLKHNLIMWTNGDISDNDFLHGVQYLLDSRTILVPTSEKTKIVINNPSTEMLKQFIRTGNTFYLDQESIQDFHNIPHPNYSLENGKPVAYYAVYLGKTPQGNPDLDYTSIFDDALKRWENANDNLHFKQMTSRDQANILVQFVVRDLGFGALGHSNVGKGFVEVQIGDNGCNGNFELYNNATVENIMIHEIGHGIGLSHSSDPNDIMYPYISSIGYQYCVQKSQ